MLLFRHRTWLAHERLRERRELVEGLRESAERVTNATRSGNQKELRKAIEKGERLLHSRAVIADEIRRSELHKIWGAITAIAYEQRHASAALKDVLSNEVRSLLNVVAEFDAAERPAGPKVSRGENLDPKHSEYAEIARRLPLFIEDILDSDESVKYQHALEAGDKLLQSSHHIHTAIQLTGLDAQWRHLVHTAQRHDQIAGDLQLAAICCLDCVESVYRLLFGLNRWILRRAVKAHRELRYTCQQTETMK